MNVVTLDDLGPERWDRFCLESDDAWFLHTTHWLDYTLSLNPPLFGGVPEAFAVTENGDVLAVCPLISENRSSRYSGGRQFAYGGEACPIPALRNGLAEEKRRETLDCVFAHIDHLARQRNMARASFRHNTLAISYRVDGPIPLNIPIRYGYLENNLFSQVVDLHQEEEQLLRTMRKGHRYDIHKAIKILDCEVFGQQTISDRIFGLYGELHAKAAGRQTRPSRTFELMRSWVSAGMAALCGARLDRQYVGFALVFTYKDGGFYASSCNDPDHKALPIGHGIQWGLIRYLKGHGIKRYDLGLQFWNNMFHYLPSPKEIAISRFKRGFGGNTVPVLSAEKYFGRTAFGEEFSGRVASYIEAWER